MLRAVALTLLLSARVAESGSSMASDMMDMATKMMSGGHSPEKCAGPTCCTQSTCYVGPGVGCDSARGTTKCIGAKLFPPIKGMCSCQTGACGTDGRCPDAPQAAAGSTFQEPASPPSGQASTPSGWSRLYAEGAGAAAPIPQEDFTAAFAVLGVAGAALSLGAVAFGLRLQRRRRAGLHPSERLMAGDEDGAADHEDGLRGHTDEGVE
mmetsp:Transcript_37604/g.75787  ORF Transcript_37604/g.75787 Transcript_37604/m.75787 type:complete len:209 (-) Transcript_37604:219-845(-)